MENKEYIEKLQGLSNADLIDECCFNYNMALLLKKGNDTLVLMGGNAATMA